MSLRNMHWKSFLSVVVLGGFFMAGFSSAAGAWEPKPPEGTQAPPSWYLNGRDGRYFVPIVQGKLSSATIGVVKTDSNCMPDSQGLSHCYNQIKLLSGATITIQNTHKMSNFRCLRPGERVAVRPNGIPSWAIVQVIPKGL
jgi:hypothetical protein